MGKIIRLKRLQTTGYTRLYQYEGTTYRVSSSFCNSSKKGKAPKTLKKCIKAVILKDPELTDLDLKDTITSSTTLCPLERRSNADKE